MAFFCALWVISFDLGPICMAAVVVVGTAFLFGLLWFSVCGEFLVVASKADVWHTMNKDWLSWRKTEALTRSMLVGWDNLY